MFTTSSPGEHDVLTLPNRGGADAVVVRASLPLALLLLSAYAVATLQWWALVPALAALAMEQERTHPAG